MVLSLREPMTPSELEDTPPPSETAEQREARRDKEMAWMLEALNNMNHLLRNHVYGEHRSMTPSGFPTPPAAPPRVSEEILPSPPLAADQEKKQELQGTLEASVDDDLTPMKNTATSLGNFVEQVVGVSSQEVSHDFWTSKVPSATKNLRQRRIAVKRRYHKARKRRMKTDHRSKSLHLAFQVCSPRNQLYLGDDKFNSMAVNRTKDNQNAGTRRARFKQRFRQFQKRRSRERYRFVEASFRSKHYSWVVAKKKEKISSHTFSFPPLNGLTVSDDGLLSHTDGVIAKHVDENCSGECYKGTNILMVTQKDRELSFMESAGTFLTTAKVRSDGIVDVRRIHCTEENTSSGLSPTSQVWEPGGISVNKTSRSNKLWTVDETLEKQIFSSVKELLVGSKERIRQCVYSVEFNRVLWCESILSEGTLRIHKDAEICIEGFGSMYVSAEASTDGKGYVDPRRANRIWECGGLEIIQPLWYSLEKSYKRYGVTRLMQKLHRSELQKVMIVVLKELCAGHENGFMRMKLLLHSGFVQNNGLRVLPWNLVLMEFLLFIHLEDKVCFSEASNSKYGYGGLASDEEKNKLWMSCENLETEIMSLYHDTGWVKENQRSIKGAAQLQENVLGTSTCDKGPFDPGKANYDVGSESWLVISAVREKRIKAKQRIIKKDAKKENLGSYIGNAVSELHGKELYVSFWFSLLDVWRRFLQKTTQGEEALLGSKWELVVFVASKVQLTTPTLPMANGELKQVEDVNKVMCFKTTNFYFVILLILLTYEWFHVSRPPELSPGEDKSSQGSGSAFFFYLEDKVVLHRGSIVMTHYGAFVGLVISYLFKPKMLTSSLYLVFYRSL